MFARPSRIQPHLLVPVVWVLQKLFSINLAPICNLVGGCLLKAARSRRRCRRDTGWCRLQNLQSARPDSVFLPTRP